MCVPRQCYKDLFPEAITFFLIFLRFFYSCYSIDGSRIAKIYNNERELIGLGVLVDLQKSPAKTIITLK